MKIRLLQATVVNGGVWDAESVVDVDEAEAGSLLRDGLAEMVSDERLAISDQPPTPTLTPPLPPPHRSTDGEGKKRNDGK